MIEIGRLYIKTAGREAGKKCVVVDVLDKNYVLIDGDVRRKKCNISHLEPLEERIDIKKEAAHAEIVNEFKKLGIELIERKTKIEKPKKARIKKKIKEEREVKKGLKNKIAKLKIKIASKK